MERQIKSNNGDLVLKRVLRRSSFGALIGLLIGMAWNPPFKAITSTSTDVQGLTYFSWFMAALIGMVLGAFAGLVSKHQDQQKRKAETDRKIK